MTLEELQRLTVVKLREEAMQHGDITGAHGMSKVELIEAIAPHHNIDLAAEREALRTRLAANKGDLKKEILSLRKDRDSALEGHDKEGFQSARLEIKKRKRKLRRLTKTTTVI